jgi:nitrogenase molybdenum-iron protein alpha chain
MVDISQDTVPAKSGFTTRRMLSDTHLSEAVAKSPDLREYTGKFDVIPALRSKTKQDYPYLEQQPELV